MNLHPLLPYKYTCESKAEAFVYANNLKQQLKFPKNWKCDIFQNMGWFYHVYLELPNGATLSLSRSAANNFYCMVSETHRFTHSSDLGKIEHYCDPNKAVEQTLKNIHKKAMRMTDMVNEFLNLGLIK